jgi:hypothetical protein
VDDLSGPVVASVLIAILLLLLHFLFLFFIAG